MALKIRLSRIGATHRPVFRVVVAEARSRRDGAATDSLGTYTPQARGNTLQIDLARVDHWLGKGAQPTDTIRSLIKKERRRQVSAPQVSAPQKP